TPWLPDRVIEGKRLLRPTNYWNNLKKHSLRFVPFGCCKAEAMGESNLGALANPEKCNKFPLLRMDCFLFSEMQFGAYLHLLLLDMRLQEFGCGHHIPLRLYLFEVFLWQAQLLGHNFPVKQIFGCALRCCRKCLKVQRIEECRIFS